MSLFGDLEKQAIESVLGTSNKSEKETPAATKASKSTKKTSVKSTVSNDLIDLAAKNIKKYTPDAIDKIVDDVAGGLAQ